MECPGVCFGVTRTKLRLRRDGLQPSLDGLETERDHTGLWGVSSNVE